MKWLAFFLTILFVGMTAGCQTADSPAAYTDISGEELHSLLEDGEQFLLVDVREEEEYEQGHIPGAILFPLGQLKENHALLDPEEAIVLICRSGLRSAEAAEFLSEQGYDRVYNLEGGMLDWPGQVVQDECLP